MTVSIPPLVPGNPRGWLRVQLQLDVDTPADPETRVYLGIRWWGSDSEHIMSVERHQVRDGDVEVIIPCVIRTSRTKFVDWLRDAPRRQALEVVYRTEDGSGKKQRVSGYVPLASLIERLAVVELNTVSCRDIRVGLRERSALGESPKSPLGVSDTNILCNIDVSFDSGDRIASERVPELLEQNAVDRLADLSLSSKRGAPILLGQDSLDELGADPGWPSYARRLDVHAVSVRFDQLYAPLHTGDDARVYLTLGMCKDGSDQKVTASVPFHRTGSPGHTSLHASWSSDEVVSFDPMNASSPKAVERTSTDSHTSMATESGVSMHSRRASQSPVSPILRVGLWKKVKVLDQFHTFSGGMASHGDGIISPYDGLIGSAVVVATGALSQEEGVEIPLYNSELKKSGTVHLKIVTNDECSLDDSTALNYELLSSMKTLARHVDPVRADDVTVSNTKVKYAMSDSDNSDGACVGLAYEGAVSCSDDEGELVPEQHQMTTVQQHEKTPCIISDDWIFNIEKSAC